MVRIGMIGTGNIAHTHLHRLKNAVEAQVVAICDPSEDSRARIKERFGLDQVAEFSDHRQMFVESELDAVIICSPHTLHYRHALDALAAGKHVLVEKPLTCSSA